MSQSPNCILFTYISRLDKVMKNNTKNNVESGIMETNMGLFILGQFGIYVGGLVLLVLFTFITCFRPGKVEVQDYLTVV
jgi:hypothetical protein